jgi:hypothetical protein
MGAFFFGVVSGLVILFLGFCLFMMMVALHEYIVATRKLNALFKEHPELRRLLPPPR